MDFSFSEEQQMLRSSLRGFLQDRYDFEARRAATLSASGWRPELWRALGQELGVLALAFPERVGGLDAEAVSTLVVMEELVARWWWSPISTASWCAAVCCDAPAVMPPTPRCRALAAASR